ncbi:O-antigen/teichoic acid export membrane protein [Actinomycetospora succinea]|uniref:O-antigen/teichoic acid export membrane protein n=1 Tax=Actinomycetospora succinea TaxID=663603 RepID=A0A4R6VI05_9PSEU|nr:oligosaccharide flippase family protein [Actinomycetospora succinea]TDQ62887.1 O-antigen/teichoic acid export membrane protein [Actinomycetospora succinea]
MRTQQSAATGTAVLVVAVALTAPLHYVFALALAWLLPTAEFGVVGALLTVLLLATTVLAAGFPWALAREVARADEDGGEDTDAAFRGALVGNVGLGVGLAGGFAAVQLTTGAILPGVGAGPTLLVAGAIVVVALGQVLVGGLQGARRFTAVGTARTVEVVVKVVLGVGLVALLGAGASGVGWALLAGAAGAAGGAWWTLRDRLPSLRGAVAGARSFAAAAPMAAGTVGFGLIGTLDVLLLGALGHGHGVTFAAVGVYQVAAMLAKAPVLVGSALSEAVFPFIARSRDAAEAHGWFVTAFRWIPLALTPAVLVLVVTPETLIGRLFPAGYAEAAGPVRVVALGSLGLIAGDMLLKALCARGFAGVAAVRLPAAALAEVVTMVLLVPGHGVLGAAVGFAVGAWVSVLVLGALYVRHHRVGRVRARVALRWSAATAVLVALLAGAAVAGAGADLPMVALGLVGYGVLAVRWGLVPAADVVRVRDRLGLRVVQTG